MQAYPLPSSVKPRPGAHNLPELVTRFPDNGKGMKAFRKSWPADSYWLLMHINITSNKTARLYGIQYWKGELISDKVAKVRGATKRGIWQFDINGAFGLPPGVVAEYLKQQAATGAEEAPATEDQEDKEEDDAEEESENTEK